MPYLPNFSSHRATHSLAVCYELPLTSLTETGALGLSTSQRPLQLTSAGLTQRASRTGTLQMPLLPYLIRTPWLCRQSYAAQIPTSPLRRGIVTAVS